MSGLCSKRAYLTIIVKERRYFVWLYSKERLDEKSSGNQDDGRFQKLIKLSSSVPQIMGILIINEREDGDVEDIGGLVRDRVV